MKERIAVLGGGTWGATLAALLHERGHDTALWEFAPDAADRLRQTRRLPTLPHLQLPEKILVSSELEAVLDGRGWVLSVTPSAHVRSTWRAVKASGRLSPDARVISASKGIEFPSLRFLTEVMAEETGLSLDQFAVLSGPSHAEEVCRQVPTAVVAASKSRDLAHATQQLFSTDYFRVYLQDDWIGVELGGMLKNIYAIGAGMADGLECGDNTRAALLTRGLNEMARLGVACGARRDTFFGLAGLGDLIVTCLSAHSRNHSLGEKIGRGQSPKEALASMTMVAEGMANAPAALALARQKGIDCPLIQEIHAVLYEDKQARQSLTELMRREPTQEWHA